jgi:hypothetical protein
MLAIKKDPDLHWMVVYSEQDAQQLLAGARCTKGKRSEALQYDPSHGENQILRMSKLG